MERSSADDLALILAQQDEIIRLKGEVATLEQLLWQATDYEDPFEEYRASVH